MIFCYNSNSRWQHSDNKNLDSPYFTDNLSTPDNMSKNTHTKLFKLQFSGASGNKSASAAGGRASELIYCAAVDKIEEKRKPEDFIGHRKRGG